MRFPTLRALLRTPLMLLDLNRQFFQVYLLEHLGGPTDLLTLVGADHFFFLEDGGLAQWRRFTLAFLGFHLQGVEEYAQYLTEEFVEGEAPGLSPRDSYTSLVWGVYEG